MAVGGVRQPRLRFPPLRPCFWRATRDPNQRDCVEAINWSSRNHPNPCDFVILVPKMVVQSRRTQACVALVTVLVLGGTAADASPSDNKATQGPAQRPHLTIGHARFDPVTLAVGADISQPKQQKPSADDRLTNQLVRKLRHNLELFGTFRVVINGGHATGHVTVRAKRTAKGQVRVHMQSRPLATPNSGKTFTYQARMHPDDLWRLARRLADDIHRQATGRPGPFATTHIAAVQQIGPHKQIVLLHPDGRQKQRVTSAKRHGTLNILPRFSRNGDALYWTTYKNVNPDLVRLELNSDSAANLAFVSRRPGINASAAEAPNGTLVLTLSLGQKSDIYRLNPAKKSRGAPAVVRLTANPWKVNLSPDVGPSGDIVYLSANLDGTRPRVHLMNADGSNQRLIVRQGTFHQSPRFSPDGRFIAFTARDEFKRFDIFLFHVKTARLHRVTQGPGDNREPAFSPDGQLLVFTRAWSEKGRDGRVKQRRELFVSTLDGNHQRQLTTNGPYWTPTWGLREGYANSQANHRK